MTDGVIGSKMLHHRASILKDPLFVLAPHPDDAAFSVGGLLVLRAKQVPTPRTIILTLFNRSCWAFGEFNEDMHGVSAIRLREEQLYAKAVSADLHMCDLPDTSLRCTHSPTPQVGKSQEFAEVVAAVEQGFRALEIKPKGSLLLAPLGLGRHEDHLATTRIANLLKAEWKSLLFYEDLPYVGFLRRKDYEVLAKRLFDNYISIKIDITEVLDIKLRNLRLYNSQFSRDQHRSVRRHGRRAAASAMASAETLWMKRA